MEAWYPYFEVSVSEEMEILFFESQSCCSLLSARPLRQWSSDAQEEGEGGGAVRQRERKRQQRRRKKRKGKERKGKEEQSGEGEGKEKRS